MGHRHDHVLKVAIVFAAAPLVVAGPRALAQQPTPSPASESSAAAPEAQHAILGPVLTTDGAAAKGDKEIPLRKVTATDPFVVRAREMENALREAAQDLGLELDLGAPLPADGAKEPDLIKVAAAGHWAISPRLFASGSDTFTLRMVAVPPKGTTLLVRFEKVDGAHLAARAVVMLRDLVSMKLAQTGTSPHDDQPFEKPEEEERRSRGRPVLAASSTLFGLYAAFAIHRVSGGEDPRLLYPLLALGSGIGLGASLLASDEWNVTPGAAWTIAAGSWWGVVAGLNLAIGRDVRPVDDRYAFGLAGGLLGTTLAVTAIGITRYDEGDAALVHSGAALGTFGGGVLDLLFRGTLKAGPEAGLGYGAGLGLVAGGALAAAVDTSAQRVLMVDLGAGLGALGGASLASPLVVRSESTTKTRLFLGSVLAGTFLGGGIAWLATRQSAPAPVQKAKVLPTVAVAGDPWLPVWTAGFAGKF